MCRVGQAIAVVVGNLFGAALGLGVECDFCLALATGYWLGARMGWLGFCSLRCGVWLLVCGFAVLWVLTGRIGDD